MKHVTHHIKFIATKSSGEVSGVLMLPANPEFLYVFAHGAGAPMNHPFMEKASRYLAEESIGTLRYNFPYIEKKRKSPDPGPVLMATVRSAITTAKEYAKDIPLLAGGKSMGGRMTSMAASEETLPGVKGIVFYGFPLHAPGKPSDERAAHLFHVKIPMLFLQGTRDKLADLHLFKPVISKLEDKATLYIEEGADHSFQFLKSAGKTTDDVLKDLAKEVKKWAKRNY